MTEAIVYNLAVPIVIVLLGQIIASIFNVVSIGTRMMDKAMTQIMNATNNIQNLAYSKYTTGADKKYGSIVRNDMKTTLCSSTGFCVAIINYSTGSSKFLAGDEVKAYIYGTLYTGIDGSSPLESNAKDDGTADTVSTGISETGMPAQYNTKDPYWATFKKPTSDSVVYASPLTVAGNGQPIQYGPTEAINTVTNDQNIADTQQYTPYSMILNRDKKTLVGTVLVVDVESA